MSSSGFWAADLASAFQVWCNELRAALLVGPGFPGPREGGRLADEFPCRDNWVLAEWVPARSPCIVVSVYLFPAGRGMVGELTFPAWAKRPSVEEAAAAVRGLLPPAPPEFIDIVFLEPGGEFKVLFCGLSAAALAEPPGEMVTVRSPLDGKLHTARRLRASDFAPAAQGEGDAISDPRWASLLGTEWRNARTGDVEAIVEVNASAVKLSEAAWLNWPDLMTLWRRVPPSPVTCGTCRFFTLVPGQGGFCRGGPVSAMPHAQANEYGATHSRPIYSQRSRAASSIPPRRRPANELQRRRVLSRRGRALSGRVGESWCRYANQGDSGHRARFDSCRGCGCVRAGWRVSEADCSGVLGAPSG